jgi:phosphoribosylformimino-5-aminoimidazole carboxamide ribotide isomerase
MECIPSIDLSAARVVRLQQGDFARVSEYAVSPLDLARDYAAAGARRLHVVDLDAACNRGSNRDLLPGLCRVPGLNVQVGGGVRSASDLTTAFESGAAAVVVGSLAVRDVPRVRNWLGEYGGERIVLALDVRLDGDGVPQVLTDAWRESGGASLWEILDRYRDAGLRKVLCTDASRDGLLAGPNLELYRECLERFPGLEWQASGGVAGAGDLTALAAAGVSAAVVGRALLEGRMDPGVLGTYRGAA